MASGRAEGQRRYHLLYVTPRSQQRPCGAPPQNSRNNRGHSAPRRSQRLAQSGASDRSRITIPGKTCQQDALHWLSPRRLRLVRGAHHVALNPRPIARFPKNSLRGRGSTYTRRCGLAGSGPRKRTGIGSTTRNGDPRSRTAAWSGSIDRRSPCCRWDRSARPGP